MEPHTLRVERSISRAQKIQLDSLNRQLQACMATEGAFFQSMIHFVCTG